MRKIDIQEMRSIQLDILQNVHDFCVKNNIHYSLCGGTLIGAVRHKGYIPWDDDIDIMMPRPDYEKFIFLFSKAEEIENQDYRITNPFTDKQCFLPFSKVVNTKTRLIENYDRSMDNLGVYIDVFPVDGLPADNKKKILYWKFINKIKLLNSTIYDKNDKKEHGIKKVFRLVLFYLFRILPANIFAKRINRIAMKNNFENSDFVADSIFGYGQKEEVSKKVFEDFISLDFEDRVFYAMKGYDIYLKNVYGDYMQLPPVEKQVAKHDVEVYWR